ncbi:hypothetical protein H1230_17325 [Paenibacillus sp. 19GGS1-52]|uniref:hypothetical protein n=1 Tax=Paenibacillus sp. 19GGS1-52 TaxID=2758563 RepID=UPI001EFA8679|nr:hypothetical protein [Paenibacillus sp. 19GGS1-52]ULO04900.1 hypothetical protein H1230_17325 [Paenibacillus sp. 19GGS1-52]
MTLAKYFKFSMTLLFVLLICSACQSNREEGLSEYISVDELKNLSDKGVSLSWDDFNKYSFEDIGSGLYIRKYKIEGGHQLFITGKSLESPPEKIYIVNQSGKELDLTPDNLSELSG